MQTANLALKLENKESIIWPNHVNKPDILLHSYIKIRLKVIPAQSAKYSSFCETRN